MKGQAPTDAYSRLYHKFAKEYPAIYADDHLLATWVRLLMLADAAWPLHPPMPRSTRAAYLRRLVEGDKPLVILEGDYYTVRGLDAERTRRSNAGRVGADKRWHSDGNATASSAAMPSRDETRRDEIPPPPAQRGRRAEGTTLRDRREAPRDQGTNARANGTSQRQQHEASKHGGLERLGAIAARAAEVER